MESSFTISFMNDRATLGPRVWDIIRSSGWPPTTWPGWNGSVFVSHAIAAQAEWYELPPLPPQVGHTAAKLASACLANYVPGRVWQPKSGRSRTEQQGADERPLVRVQD